MICLLVGKVKVVVVVVVVMMSGCEVQDMLQISLTVPPYSVCLGRKED